VSTRLLSYVAVASERRLTGTINSDDGFKAVSSMALPSSFDPQLAAGICNRGP
jgi:hypothetical protein